MRAAVACTVVWVALYFWQEPIIRPLLPVYRLAAWVLSPEFSIDSIDLRTTNGARMARFQANLSAPLEYRGRAFVPFGWGQMPQGSWQVELPLGSLLSYAACVLIVVLAWPVASTRELALRTLFTIPAVAVLLSIGAPLTVVAELWQSLHDEVDPQSYCAWMKVSRFLMGGGGFALAFVAATTVIAAAKQRSPRPARPDSPTYIPPGGGM